MFQFQKSELTTVKRHLARCVVMRWLGETDLKLNFIWQLNTSSRRWHYDFLELSSTGSSSMVLWKEVWNWIWRSHLSDEFQWLNADNDEVISGTLIRMKRALIRSSTNKFIVELARGVINNYWNGNRLNRLLGTGKWDTELDVNEWLKEFNFIGQNRWVFGTFWEGNWLNWLNWYW